MAACECDAWTGLPILILGPIFFDLPKNERRFVIAHELGHFALGHTTKSADPVNEKIFPKNSEGEKSKEKVKLARSRVDELEADRFAIINLGVNYQDALAWMNQTFMKDEEIYRDYPNFFKRRNTFESSHPLFPERIKQMEALGQDLRLGKLRLNLMTDVDWDNAIKQCFYQKT